MRVDLEGELGEKKKKKKSVFRLYAPVKKGEVERGYWKRGVRAFGGLGDGCGGGGCCCGGDGGGGFAWEEVVMGGFAWGEVVMGLGQVWRSSWSWGRSFV